MNQEYYEQDSPLQNKEDASSSQIYEEDVLLQQTSKDLLSRQEEIIRQFEEKLSKTVQLVKQNCSLQSNNNTNISEYYPKEEQFENQKIESDKQKNFQFQFEQFTNCNEKLSANLFENKVIEQNIQCIKEESIESEKEDEDCQECKKKETILINQKEQMKLLENQKLSLQKDLEREKTLNQRKFSELKENNTTFLTTIEEKYKLSFEIQKQKYEEKYQELLKSMNQREDDSNKKILELTTKNKKLYNLIIQLELEKSELSQKSQQISQQIGVRSTSRQNKPNTSNQIPRYKKQGTNLATPKREKPINFQNTKLMNSLNNSLFHSGDKNQLSQIDITNSVLQESTQSNNFMDLMATEKNLGQTRTMKNLSEIKKQKKTVISARKPGKENSVNSTTQFKKKIKESNQKPVVIQQKQTEKQQIKTKRAKIPIQTKG